MKKGKESLQALLILILVVAVLHLVRAVLGWPMVISTFEVPIWWSYIAFIVLGFLSYKLYMSLKK